MNESAGSLVCDKATAALLNDMVPKASGKAAFCMGIASALHWARGGELTRALLEDAARCERLGDVILVLERHRPGRPAHKCRRPL